MLTNRRQALKTLTVSAFTSAFIGGWRSFAATPEQSPSPAAPVPKGPYTLPPLPYAYSALEPSIDTETMHLHHDKHHAAYVNKLNEALAKEPTFTPPAQVDDLMKNLSAVPESIRTAVRNQGGGHSNHSLFWLTLSPTGGAPKAEFAKALTDELGGLAKFKETMAKEGGGLFGSGWVWLVLDGNKKLAVITLPNQNSPWSEGKVPLFGIDVWEHAYYLKYQNRRPEYLAAFWNVVNWDFVSDRYATALKA